MKLIVGVRRSFLGLSLLASGVLGCEKFATCEQTKTCEKDVSEGGEGGEGRAVGGTTPSSGGKSSSGGPSDETSPGDGGSPSEGGVSSGGTSSSSGGTTSESCVAGEFRDGDRCVACAEGTFSTTTDAPSCVAWTVCVTGLEETKAGTVKSDRVCEVKEFVRQFGTLTNTSVRALVHLEGTTYLAMNDGGTNTDARLLAFDLSGVSGAEIVGSTSGVVAGNSLALGSDGSVHWAGTADKEFAGAFLGATDAWVRKYSASGSFSWGAQFGVTGGDEGRAVAVDSSGNVFVAGSVTGELGSTSAGGEDVFVRKYSSTGAAGWVHQFGTANSDSALAIGIAPNGDVIVAGEVGGGLPGVSGKGGRDWVVRRLAGSSGASLDTAIVGSASVDRLHGMAIASSGAIALVGSTEGVFSGHTDLGASDAVVAVLDENLDVVWTSQFGTTLNEQATGVVFDGEGDLLIVGETDGALPGATDLAYGDVFLRKMTSTGTFVSNRIFGTAGVEGDFVAITLDSQGGILITGTTAGTFAGASGTGGAFLLRLRP